MKNKVVFFIRAYNDLDNIVPVVYAVCSAEKASVEVVITAAASLANDYRIKFLEQNRKVTITLLSDLIPGFFPALFKCGFKWSIVKEKLALSLTKFGLYNYKLNEPEIASELIISSFFKKVTQGYDKVVFCFDWTTNSFVKALSKLAREAKIPTVSLPHGAAPYLNKLETINAINYNNTDKSHLVEVFDYFVVPNQMIVEQRYSQYKNSKKVPVLGLVRYSNEWKKLHDPLLKATLFPELKGQLRILLFMRDINYAIHFQELQRTIPLICQFENVDLVVKYHTRLSNLSAKTMDLNNYLSKYPNLKLAFDDLPSPALVKWSDVVIDLGTSASFEAIVEGKNIICPEYLHPNITTTAHFFPKSVANTRDDLYKLIETMSKDKTFKTYNEQERNKFITEIIGPQNINLMNQYSNFIFGVLENKVTPEK